MPDFRFFLERGNTRSREVSFDLPDVSVVGHVAKQFARQHAAREIGTGHLHLAQDVTVLDCTDAVVARYPLADFVCFE